jgi:hypothetical protein
MFGKDLNKYSPKISTVLGYLKGCRGIAMVARLDPRWNLAHGILSLEDTRAEGPLLDTKNSKNGKRYAIITGNTDLTTESSKIQILKKNQRYQEYRWISDFSAVGHRRYRKEWI